MFYLMLTNALNHALSHQKFTLFGIYGPCSFGRMDVRCHLLSLLFLNFHCNLLIIHLDNSYTHSLFSLRWKMGQLPVEEGAE